MTFVFLEHNLGLHICVALIILKELLVEEGPIWRKIALSFLQWSHIIIFRVRQRDDEKATKDRTGISQGPAACPRNQAFHAAGERDLYLLDNTLSYLPEESPRLGDMLSISSLLSVASMATLPAPP